MSKVKQVSDKARLAANFSVCEEKSFNKALKNQTGKVLLAEGAPATVAELHLAAWLNQGNSEEQLPTDPEKLKSARNSFAGGIRKDVDRMFLRTTILKVGDKELPAIEWAKTLKLEPREAVEKIRSKKIGDGNSIVRSGIELPLPTDIESAGQRGRQACDPLAEMLSFARE